MRHIEIELPGNILSISEVVVDYLLSGNQEFIIDALRHETQSPDGWRLRSYLNGPNQQERIRALLDAVRYEMEWTE